MRLKANDASVSSPSPPVFAQGKRHFGIPPAARNRLGLSLFLALTFIPFSLRFGLKSALAAGQQGTFAVAAGADDAKERASDGQMTLDGTTLRPGTGYMTGLRFTNVAIPQGVTISSAKIRMFVVSDGNRDLALVPCPIIPDHFGV